MDPQMIMQLLQQMGLGGVPTSGPFNGHNDMLLGSFGMPTSVNMPSAYDINNVGFLGKIRESYIGNQQDATLNRIQSATGIGQRQAAAFINMFPQLQGLISTRADMLGGSYAFAQSINPLMATAALGGAEQRESFKAFESEIYNRVIGNISTFKGISSERDAGAILSFATQTGQMRGRRLQTDGTLENIDSDQMVKEAERVLENFDEVLAAGRRIFGPNAPAKQVLQKMQQLGGDVFNIADGKAMASKIEDLAIDSYASGANASAVLSSTAQNAQRLMQMGVNGSLARDIAFDASESALRVKTNNRSARAFYKQNGGFDLQEVNFETASSVYTQNRMRYMAQDSVRMRIARMSAQNRGFSGTDEVARSILQDENMSFTMGWLTDDQQAQIEQDYENAYTRETFSSLYSGIRKRARLTGLSERELKQLDAFHAVRVNDGSDSAARAAAQLRTMIDKDSSPEEAALARKAFHKMIGGGEMSDRLIKIMQGMDATYASEAADPLRDADLSGLSDEYKQRLKDSQGKAVPIGEQLLNKLAVSRSKKKMDKLESLSIDAEGNRRFSMEKITDKDLIQGLVGQSEADLAAQNYVRHSTKNDDGSIKDTFFELTDSDKTDNFTMQDALTKANSIGLGEQGMAFINKFFDELGNFVEEKFPPKAEQE